MDKARPPTGLEKKCPRPSDVLNKIKTPALAQSRPRADREEAQEKRERETEGSKHLPRTMRKNHRNEEIVRKPLN